MPPPPESGNGASADRADLAEVIELRARLPEALRSGSTPPRAEDAGEDAGPASDPPRPVARLAHLPRPELHCADQDATEVEMRTANSEYAVDSESRGGSSHPAASVRTAAEDGVRLLARRARSSGELRRELGQLGHAAAEVDAVIDEFITSLYLDDRGLARLLVQSLRERKGASRAQIRLKLRERLLPDDAIEEALGDLDDAEEFALLRAAAVDRARKLAGLDRATAERRLLGFLARRGWSGERAVRAAREALAGSSPRSGVTFR